LVERLFARFAQIFGGQKVAAMWAGVDQAELKAVWGASLGRFGTQTIGRAVQALVEQGTQWPPTLPEFAELCRQYNRPEHQVAALPAPGSAETCSDEARRNLEAIRKLLESSYRRVPA